MMIPYILVGAVAAVGLYVILTYNGLVSLKVKVSEAWSDIEVQMKRRYNLIPNLVETVKGYASYEQETLERVVRARSEAMSNQGSPTDQAKAENLLAGSLKSLFALAESYPELQANEGFRDLHKDLALVEDKIQSARRYYNGSVRLLNTKIQQFPSNLVAGVFQFIRAEFFELDESEAAAREPVKVSF